MAFERFLILLKTKGALSTNAIASELEISNEGARFQLNKLQDAGFVTAENQSSGVGRPSLVWKLTQKGWEHFPKTDLSDQLLDVIIEALGPEMLEKVIDTREQKAKERYHAQIDQNQPIGEKLRQFTKIRNEEGYMAEMKETEDGYMFFENHCPIYSGAKKCNGFCESEFKTFKNLMGRDVKIERVEHITDGDRRCAYSIRLKK
ncbi:helix-turn-helix transcriptional regulator [Taibaiella soli]|nr:metalloregulator ArsR/SmtB family transcription factor [Taibaiella soli]